MQKNLKAIFGDQNNLDKKSVDFLINALERNNLEGFDYIEFKQAMQELLAMQMDEEVVFRSVFTTAKTLGLTKEKLLKTAEYYKGVLKNEKQQFDVALQRQMQQKVQSKVEEVEKLKKQIEEYKLKIQQLEEKIQKSQDTIDHADENIRQEKEKIEATRDGFESTLQNIMNQIDGDIENFNKYL
jgi:chromosome segregation ATPase